MINSYFNLASSQFKLFQHLSDYSHQLRLSDLHGDSDLLRNEVPGISELRAQGLGDAQLPGGQAARHQDRRLRHEQEPLLDGLLQDTRKSCTAHTMDGLGKYTIGENKAFFLILAIIVIYYNTIKIRQIMLSIIIEIILTRKLCS